jgi:murein DD-endopeptidase MepM/ murein hydrolase activator NlpD
LRHAWSRASGMRRYRHVLERCRALLLVAVATVSASAAASAGWAAERPSNTGYTSGYKHGYYDGYQRGYDEAYKAAYEDARGKLLSERSAAPRRDSNTATRRQSAAAGRYKRVATQIDSTVYAAAEEAGIPPDIIAEFIRLFSYQVDFARDVQPGDKFEVVFGPTDGRENRANSVGILAASMTLSGKTETLYRFRSYDDIEYFDANGRSAMGMLMRTPVDGAKISSRFGRRYNRVHEGIDFGVPPGTPVMAAGSGDVTFAGRSRGYGNLLVIGHGNGYSTAYAHLSRFAAELRKGTRVRQGEVIAYSGATGNATGPHVHYEIRLRGAAIDPAVVREVFGRTLAGDERKRFLTERAWIDQLVASLPVQNKSRNA